MARSFNKRSIAPSPESIIKEGLEKKSSEFKSKLPSF